MDLKTRIEAVDHGQGTDGATRPVEPHGESGGHNEKRWKQTLHSRLMDVIDLALITELEPSAARRQIREIIQRLLEDNPLPIGTEARQRIMRQIEDDILGLGPLEPLLADPTVSDILVNGWDTVYVERHGRLEKVDIAFDSESHLMNVIDRIVSMVGRRIDESSPMVDARLKDGSRVNAVIPPLALDGPMLSIRRFGVEAIRMPSLLEYGTLSEDMAAFLQAAVRARLNILVSGGTGSGKTTMLNVLSESIPHTERVITIEDSAELRLQQPHVGRLETRPANIEDRGEVTQRDLVRNSLRMRPDRIIVGEVRGPEALDMLQAMNTGHDGSLTTIHANSPRDGLGRIENMVAMTGINFPARGLRAQIASALDIVLQLERQEDGRRRVVSIQEIEAMEGDTITMSEIFAFRRSGVDESGNVLGSFVSTGVMPQAVDHIRRRGIEIDGEMFDPRARK